MRSILAAGLLFLLCANVSLSSSQVRDFVSEGFLGAAGVLSSREYNGMGDFVLHKRSPAGGRKAGSSSRSRPASYYEIPAEQDTPPSAVIRSDDYLGFVDKAIISARKVGPEPFSSTKVGDGPLKWLSRATASLLRNEEQMNEHVNRYASKMAIPSLTGTQYSRAQEKKNEWDRLPNLDRDEAVEAMVFGVADSYGREADRWREELHLQREMGTPREDLVEISGKKRYADLALQLWSSNASVREIHKMINKELGLYAESAEAFKDTGGPNDRADMIEHATRAIAWYTRL